MAEDDIPAAPSPADADMPSSEYPSPSRVAHVHLTQADPPVEPRDFGLSHTDDSDGSTGNIGNAGSIDGPADSVSRNGAAPGTASSGAEAAPADASGPINGQVPDDGTGYSSGELNGQPAGQTSNGSTPGERSEAATMSVARARADAAAPASAMQTSAHPGSDAPADTVERAQPAPNGRAGRVAPGPGWAANPSRRMRARLARLGRSQQTNPVLEPLFRIVRSTHPKADLTLIEKAYQTAERCHRGQMRKSGDPYITHPVAVATILAELGMTPPTLCAALLHDTVEDTPYTVEELRADFGDEISMLVDGVTKLDKVKYGENAQAETIRKMVVAMAKDIRVLVIKLADRLHNMRTLRYVKPSTQERTARETLEIYASLAHRLGMNTLKWEIEDLAFATLHPKLYDEIVRLVAERAPSRDEYLAKVVDELNRDLDNAKLKATVSGRPKHYYSIYQKMIVRGREFGDIYDLVGIRVLTDSVRDCYAALGVIHARWNPVPGRFKDYIAMPKFNMYQSLHTSVIGPEGKPVEIQVRTYAMHRRAEYGVAAHWKYKDQANAGREVVRSSGSGPNDMAWLRQLLDWQKETEDPGEFLDSLRFEINSSQVYVFTPKGDVIALPSGATPIDFAYAIHTEVGHKCIGARVNGRLVPLESELDNGDLVEVFTSKSATAGPSRDWLTFVRSPRARNKIRQWFTKERREEAIDQGRESIAKLMRKEGMSLQRMLSHDSMSEVAEDLRYSDVSALYAAVGEGNITAHSVVRRLIELLGGEETAAEDDVSEGVDVARESRRRGEVRGLGDPGVVVKDVSDVWVKLSKCCTPVPGDAIIGFVTRGAGVSVHRDDCVNVENLRNQPERLVEVEWAPTAQSVFLVAIQVEALDRSRLLSDITRVLSDQHVNILSASVTTDRDRVARSRFTFEMGDTKHLGSVLRAVRGVDGVFDVYRLTNTGVEEVEGSGGPSDQHKAPTSNGSRRNGRAHSRDRGKSRR